MQCFFMLFFDISSKQKVLRWYNINLGRTLMSVLPPNFRFLCTLQIRDFSDIASCVNEEIPLTPTKILCVKSLTSTIPRQSIFCFELGGSITLWKPIAKYFVYSKLPQHFTEKWTKVNNEGWIRECTLFNSWIWLY